MILVVPAAVLLAVAVAVPVESAEMFPRRQSARVEPVQRSQLPEKTTSTHLVDLVAVPRIKATSRLTAITAPMEVAVAATTALIWAVVQPDRP
jgi:hypothetical protein